LTLALNLTLTTNLTLTPNLTLTQNSTFTQNLTLIQNLAVIENLTLTQNLTFTQTDFADKGFIIKTVFMGFSCYSDLPRFNRQVVIYVTVTVGYRVHVYFAVDYVVNLVFHFVIW